MAKKHFGDATLIRRPTQRVLDWYFAFYNRQKKKQFLAENSQAQKGGVVFVGDSITDMCNLNKYLPNLPVFNRGISGDTTDNLLQRLDYSVTQLQPSVVVLLVGVNDLMNLDRSPLQVATTYQRIVQTIVTDLPQATVILQSVYPGHDGKGAERPFDIAYLRDDIAQLNKHIKNVAQRYGCVYADVYGKLVDDQGLLQRQLSNDGCHPNDKGYDVVFDYLAPIVTNAFLGKS